MKGILNILILNFLFFSVGCGTLYNITEDKYSRQQRKNGQDPLHVNSCGPVAIQAAYYNLTKKWPPRSFISKEIQQNGGLTRPLLSIFSHHARSMTMPSEIINFFESRGFKIKKIKNFKELTKEDTAIILISKKNTIYYHWSCHPVDDDILTFFGDSTLIEDIYLIK